MQNQIVEFHVNDAFPLAKQHFINACGICVETEQHKTIWHRAMQVYNEIVKTIKLRAVLSIYLPEDLIGRDLFLGGSKFSCRAFESLHKNNIGRVYIYLLTAGECRTKNEQILDQLYGDIWGTALVDAGRDLLRNQIQTMEKLMANDTTLSEPFGPGFYGMNVSQVKFFFDILNAKMIGLTLGNSGLMLPEKSCAGFYLSVKDKSELPLPECESCIGNNTGCRFCKGNISKGR